MAQHFDDDMFEEDGGTFDFSEETDIPSDPNGNVLFPGGASFRVYPGEDFSEYLHDDDECVHGQWEPSWEVENGRADRSTAVRNGDNTRRRKSTAVLREKLGRLLLTSGGTGRSKVNAPAAAAAPGSQNLSRMHEVSFADCKMGNTLVDRSGAVVSSAAGSDSGIECRSGFSMETESDLGPYTSSSWWDMETLSSRQQQTRSSRSTADLRDADLRPSQTVVNEAVISSNGEIARGQRKSSDAKSDGSKRFSNPFRKLYNGTIGRRKSANFSEMSYSQNRDDLQL